MANLKCYIEFEIQLDDLNDIIMRDFHEIADMSIVSIQYKHFLMTHSASDF